MKLSKEALLGQQQIVGRLSFFHHFSPSPHRKY